MEKIIKAIRKHRTVVFLVSDAILMILAVYLSFLLRFDGQIPLQRLNHFWFTVIATLVITLPAFYFGKIYRLSWTYISLDDLPTIFRAVMLSTIILGTLFFVIVRDIPVLEGYPRSILFLYAILLLILTSGFRFSRRIYWQLIRGKLPSERKWLSLMAKAEKLVRPETLLVTGGAGYVGSVLVRKLLDMGYKVRVVDKLLYGDESIKDLYNNGNFEFISADLQSDNQKIIQAMKKVGAVIHLAAIVGDAACATRPDATIKTNYLATVNLAKICKNKGIKRFIFASTCSNYGSSENENLTEEAILRPVSLYAESKIYAEKKLIKMTDKDFMPVIFRFSTLYGLSYRMRFDLVVNLLTMKAFTDKEITIFGGNQWRPFLHVEDIAKVMIACLETPLSKITGQIFNVGSSQENYLIRDLGKIIKEVMPETKVRYIEDFGDQRTYNVLFEKLEEAFNFRPSKTVKDGVREIYKAFEERKFIDPKDLKYYNYSPER